MSATALVFLIGAGIMVYIALQTLKNSDMKIASDESNPVNQLRQKMAEAAEALDKVIHRADSAMEEGKFHDAEAALETALRMAPESEMVLTRMAYVLEKQGDAKAALATYEQALKIHTQSAELYAGYASLLKQQGERQKAKENYIEAVQLTPENPLIYYNFANLLAELGETDAAKEGYQYALDIDPEFKEAREALSALSMRKLESKEES